MFGVRLLRGPDPLEGSADVRQRHLDPPRARQHLPRVETTLPAGVGVVKLELGQRLGGQRDVAKAHAGHLLRGAGLVVQGVPHLLEHAGWGEAELLLGMLADGPAASGAALDLVQVVLAEDVHHAGAVEQFGVGLGDVVQVLRHGVEHRCLVALLGALQQLRQQDAIV